MNDTLCVPGEMIKVPNSQFRLLESSQAVPAFKRREGIQCVQMHYYIVFQGFTFL